MRASWSCWILIKLKKVQAGIGIHIVGIEQFCHQVKLQEIPLESHRFVRDSVRKHFLLINLSLLLSFHKVNKATSNNPNFAVLLLL